MRFVNVLTVTRKDISTAIDRFLGPTGSESVLRELRSSITRTRDARPAHAPASTIRDLFDSLTGHNTTDHVLRSLRVAVARASRMR
ncbi:MAG TPA: hypothetical protein VF980_14480 [Thermoanaerobaculia bacterium]